MQDMDLLQSLLAPASLQIDRIFWLPAHRLLDHQFTNREALCPDFTDWKRLIHVPVSQCADEVANPSITNKNQSSSTPQTSKTTKSAKSTVPSTCSRHINPSPQKEGRIRIARTATPFVACDVLAVAVASKRLELISLVLSKLNVQIYNCFHRIAPYRLCRREEQLLARDEKGPLQMLNLEVMGNCSFWDKEFFRSKEFAKQLPALYALNIYTRLPDGNTRAPVPEHVVICIITKCENSRDGLPLYSIAPRPLLAMEFYIAQFLYTWQSSCFPLGSTPIFSTSPEGERPSELLQKWAIRRSPAASSRCFSRTA